MENKYAVYRNIRYQRTFRPLGKMTWWRIVLGIILMLAVLLISGFISQRLAGAGHFYAAEKLMIYPEWMEKHKPETKAFIEAGVVYADGNFEAAAEAFGAIEQIDAAPAMEALSLLKLSEQLLSAGDYDKAYEAFAAVDSSLISETDMEIYLSTGNALYDALASGDASRAAEIKQLLDSIA